MTILSETLNIATTVHSNYAASELIVCVRQHQNLVYLIRNYMQ
jgi:hypothetical protein